MAERANLRAETTRLRGELESLQVDGARSLELEAELSQARSEIEAARADLDAARREIQERDGRLQGATAKVQGLLDRLLQD